MKRLPLAAASFVSGPLCSICPPIMTDALSCDSLGKEKEKASFLTVDIGCTSANSELKNSTSAEDVNVFIKARVKLQTFIINLSLFCSFQSTAKEITINI